jgi:hypothetical protein
MAVNWARDAGGRSWLALALIGAVGIILSGLFAIGGGILMVPLLVWRARLDQRRASATSLAAILPAAVVGSATYLAHGEVDIAAAAFIAIGAAGGAAVGGVLLRRIPLVALSWMFIIFILAVAARLLLTPRNGVMTWLCRPGWCSGTSPSDWSWESPLACSASAEGSSRSRCSSRSSPSATWSRKGRRSW